MKNKLNNSDNWETPQILFDQLNAIHEFDVDACATADNSKCPAYMPDALNSGSWARYKSVWMNPPYSSPLPFVQMAYRMSQYCKVVLLLKCDTSTRTFGVYYDYDTNSPKPGVTIHFLPKRLKFERNGVPHQSAPFPSVVVIMDRRKIN